ncbi:MAG: O-antigen ligase family protein [Acidobacteriota bacterium]|nr:O-antigen ligase family protein [Acidobacteriota bacterium]
MFIYYILLVMLPMPDHPWWARTVAGPITVMKLVGLACLAAAVVYLFLKGSFPSVLRAKPARWYLIFFLVSVASYFVHLGGVTFETGIMPNLLAVLSLFIVTMIMVDSVRRLRKVALVSMAAVTIGSLYVIRQWLTFHSVYAGFRSWGGVAGDPNYYAITVVIWLPVMWYWLMHKRPALERLFLLGCAGIVIIAFAMASSRGGFLGLMGSLIFILARSRRRVRNLVIVCLLMAPLFLIPGASPAGRLFHPDKSDQESSENRVDLWTAGMHEFENHPLFGVGWGHFQPVIIKNGVRTPLPFHVSHNTYIDLAAQLGLVGLIPFLIMLFAAFRACGAVARKTMNTGPPDLHQTALGMQAGILGYAIATFFLSTWWQQIFWLGIFLAASMVLIERSLAGADAHFGLIKPAETKWNQQLQSIR